MKLTCKCGKNCFKSARTILKSFKKIYTPCDDCKEYKLKKFSPLATQMDLNLLDAYYGKCDCGKRHLDVVMSHILKTMIDEGIKSVDSTLRDVCVPLITPAYPLETVPYLKDDSLVILSKDVDKNCANRILKEIPEVKGVLKGDIKDIIGIRDIDTSPQTYELLVGCDLRCDIVHTPWKLLCIYKYQGQIHIEFPRLSSPKIEKLKTVFNKYEKPKVLDCTCGPGTLGIAALSADARRVVFNDLWLPACQTTALNLEINGFRTEFSGRNKGLIASGDNFDIYCLDIKDLKNVLDDVFDVCLVDVFPGVNPDIFVNAVENICREVVII